MQRNVEADDKEGRLQTMRYTLEGLDCANCAAKIERGLQAIDGLEAVKVNFATKSIELSPAQVAVAQEVITRIEPDVMLRSASEHPDLAGKDGQGQGHAIIISGILFIIGIIFYDHLHQTPYSWLEYVVFLSAYVLVGGPVIGRAFRQILQGRVFDEHFLMTIATFGAIAIHQLPEAVGVMLFYAIGEFLQKKAVDRSRRSIQALLEIQPEYANLKDNGSTREVRPQEVAVGQYIVVKPGERVPLDGKVVEGVTFVDTSALTGESVPRRVEPGKSVLAGMVNGQGLITVKVAKRYADSSIARILELVEKAAERKAPTEKFISVFAGYYTPVVVGTAVLIAVLPPLVIPGATFAEWIYRALVLLVISCPCALMVSIPLGYFGGIGGASRKGILIKGANFLDALAKTHTVVFDKTGTLTKGVFRVTGIHVRNGFTKEQLIAVAAEAETFSNHPIAQSLKEAYGREVAPEHVRDYQEIPAHGISAIVDGHRVLAGNDRLMHREGIVHEDCDAPGTSVYVAIGGEYAGYIVISDEIRDDAAEAIASLKTLGVRKTVMLTGDEQSVAQRVAGELGLDEFHAGLLPEDKVAQVEELLAQIPHPKQQKLVFIGDGVNDAPVITRADIGVAMGGLGSAAAIEAADVVLMEDAPAKLPQAIAIARRTNRIVWQNIIMALVVKAFFIFLGSIGVASIWEAVFADVGVTLLAVFNAARTLQINKAR